ncbi:MAG: HAD family hydrolase [Solirubrobacterales bacterium]
MTAGRTLVVCDLDGTLLRSDATLSDFARNGLNHLVAAGLALTVASARSTAAMRQLLPGLELRLPVIEINGAFVSDLDTGRHLASATLARDAARAAVELVARTGVDPVLTTWDGERDRVHHSTCTNLGTHWYVEEKRAYGDPRLTASRDLPAVAAAESVASVITFTPESDAAVLVAELEAALGPVATVLAAEAAYVPGWTEISVQDPSAEKGAAIAGLLEAVGLDRDSTEVVVCGDHLNDLPMFGIADRSVAPANGHADVLRHASVVVGGNDEDGVVRHLLAEHLDGAAAC